MYEACSSQIPALFICFFICLDSYEIHSTSISKKTVKGIFNTSRHLTHSRITRPPIFSRTQTFTPIYNV